MAKFRFRLEPLLKLRQAERDERRKELAEAYKVEEIILGQIRQADEAMENLKLQNKINLASRKVDLDALNAAQRYEISIRMRKISLERQHKTIAEEIEERRTKLIAASREVKKFQRLKEKKLEHHQAEELHEEIKTLDEMASLRQAQEV